MKQNKPTYQELKARLAELERALQRAQDELESRAEERTTALAALREAELRYRMVADFTYDWEYWQDPAGALRYVSPACERITGYTAEQFSANPRLLDQLVLPQDAQAWFKHSHNHKERGLQEIRFRIRRRDGEIAWIEHVCQPVVDEQGAFLGYHASNRDITGRVQAEASLRLLSSAVEQSHEGVAVSDLEGNLQFVNHAFAAMHGYVPGELVGEHLSIFHTPEQLLEVKAANRQLHETGEFQGEIWHARRDGAVFPTRMHNSILRDEAGQPTNMIATLHDITEQVQAQEAVRRRTAQLEALHEIGLEITAQLDLEALLVSIASQAVKLLDGAMGCLCLHRPERDALERVVSIGRHVPPTGTILRQGKDIPGYVWKSGAPLIVNDRRRWDGRAPIFDKHPNAAVIGMPVKWGDEFLGVLSVGSPDNATRAFSPADGELLRLFATQAAIAIKNAQIHERAQQDARDKAMLLREVNHRVKNNLTSIISLLHAAKSQAEVKDQAVLDDLIGRVRGLATVHAMLSTSQWQPLPLDELATKVIHATLNAFPGKNQVSVNVASFSVNVTPSQAHHLALVLNELTINTVKHALGERDEARVTFQVALDGGTARCEFRDDGPGYPPDVLQSERQGIGFNLVQSIVRHNLGGELALRNDGGAVTLIAFDP
jgi:PAS domain S-box-containing protein